MSCPSTSPRVVIALATYNGEAFLKPLLDSLLKQSYPCDIYISDDHSSDSTPEILNSYAATYSKITLINAQGSNLGPIGNFSYLLTEVLEHKWEYLCLADQDDLWHQNKVERLLESSSATQSPELIYSDLRVVRSDGSPIHQSFMLTESLHPAKQNLARQLVENVSPGCSMMLNRPLVEIGSPIPSQAIMHDWWFALVAHAIGEVQFLPESLIDYRQHEKNTLGLSRWDLKKMAKKLGDKNFIDRYYRQAQVLHRLVSDKNHDSKELVENFLNTSHYDRISRSVYWIRYKHRKGGLIHTIGLHLASLLYRQSPNT